MRPEEELRFLILAAQREGNRMLSAQLAPLGLTPSQAEVIRCLEDHGPMSLKALGELLVCEGGSPSRLVDAMVTREMVTRIENASDRRQVRLELSRTGRTLARRVRTIEAALYDRIGQGLGEAGLTTALALLRPLVAGSGPGDAITRRKSLGVKSGAD